VELIKQIQGNEYHKNKFLAALMSILTPYPRKSDKPETPKYRNLRNSYQIFAV